MSARERIYGRVAQQLGHPAGLAGRLLALGLNRGNRKFTENAVVALASPKDAILADVGFGGGVGLRLLSDL
jgi:arsenite methyltransferase